jgi:hypothetical protein
VKDLNGRTEEWAAIKSVMSTWFRKRSDEKTFAQTLENLQHLLQLINKSRNYTFTKTINDVRGLCCMLHLSTYNLLTVPVVGLCPKTPQ